MVGKKKKILVIGFAVLSAAAGIFLMTRPSEIRIFLDPKDDAVAQEIEALSNYVSYESNEGIIGVRKLLKNNPPLLSSEETVIARSGWDSKGRKLQLTSVLASRNQCPYVGSRYALMFYKDVNLKKGVLCWVWNGNTVLVHDRGTDFAELAYGVINPKVFGLNSAN